jgi:hypothetical protein
MPLNKEQIIDKIKEYLAEQSGEKTGGSRHLSHVSISNITVDLIQETKKDDKKQLKVAFSYTVDIQSEFTIEEKPTMEKETYSFNPYHYRKKDEIIIPI